MRERGREGGWWVLLGGVERSTEQVSEVAAVVVEAAGPEESRGWGGEEGR
jgi:hypothetical protein